MKRTTSTCACIYSPSGRRNYGRPLKRLLDTWDRNGSTSGPTPWQIYNDDDVPLCTGAIKILLANINWDLLLKIQLTAQKLGTTLLLIFKHIKSCPNTIIQCEHWDLCTEGTWLKCICMCATNIIANRTVPFNLTYTWISSTCYFWNYSVFITYLCYCRSSKIGKT